MRPRTKGEWASFRLLDGTNQREQSLAATMFASPTSKAQRPRSMKNVRAIFFDVDDTLFDRRGAQREIARRMVRRLPRLFGGTDEAGVIDAFLESDELSLKAYRLGASPDRMRAKRTQIFLGFLGL